jgi:hypothetical protein
MKRRAGMLVLLGMLGGCFAPRSDPVAIDLPMAGRPPAGNGVAGPLRPRGPMGVQDWANSQRGSTVPGMAGQPAAANATTVAGLASSTPAGALPEYTVGRPSAAGSAPAPFQAEAEPRSGAGSMSVVNTRRLQINYEVKDVGPSGLAAVELWYTHNGGAWAKYGDAPQQPPFVVDVADEGVYGFTLLARNRAGQGKSRPYPGDKAQITVEVDTTKPAVEVATPQVNGQEKTLTILWQASDKNLGPQPIALCWSRDPAGPWVPIITQLENTGRYVWKLPAGVPSRVWVQVEASDLAGNVAAVRSTDAVALAPNPDQLAAAIVAVEARQPAAPAETEEPPQPARTPTLTLEPLNE